MRWQSAFPHSQYQPERNPTHSLQGGEYQKTPRIGKSNGVWDSPTVKLGLRIGCTAEAARGHLDAGSAARYTRFVHPNSDTTHQHIDFPEMCRRYGSYPKDISSNLDVIFRFIVGPLSSLPLAGAGSGAAWVKEGAGACYLCEYRFLQSLFQRRSHIPVTARADSPSPGGVLVPLSPYRIDHHAFIYPVTNILADRGVETSILVSRRHFRPHEDPELFRGSLFLFAEDFLTLHVYKRARSQYNQLAPWINKMCSDLRLDSTRRRRLHALYQNYSVDRSLMAEVLALTRPSVTYGLHFMSNPGYLAAIDGMLASGSTPVKLLIQHGAGPSEDFHDFKGADTVIVWGDYSASFLKSNFLIPVPPSRALGNPKLEAELRRLKQSEGGTTPVPEEGTPKCLLFVSTLDTPPDDYHGKALSLFAASVHKCRGPWRVIYRPHPGESLDRYHRLIEEGLMAADQIADRSMPIYELIGRADLVAGGFSSVIPEAAALGKPVVQILPEMSGTDWVRCGMAGASTEQELCSFMQGVLSDRDYRQKVLSSQQTLVESMFSGVFGSSERIADFIAGLL